MKITQFEIKDDSTINKHSLCTGCEMTVAPQDAMRHRYYYGHLRSLEQKQVAEQGLIYVSFYKDHFFLDFLEILDVPVYASIQDLYIIPGWFAFLWNKHRVVRNSNAGKRVRSHMLDPFQVDMDRLRQDLNNDPKLAVLSEKVERAKTDERYRNTLVTQYGLSSNKDEFLVRRKKQK